MKLPESLKPSRLFAKDRRGVALVTVLTVMALTTILVLTFFSLATSEHRASSTYSQGLQAQQVGEQAVNFVIAQIREATTVGTTKAWASQPGAIRQWDNTGGASFAYKLYSDERMKVDPDGDTWSDFQSDFADLQGWSSKPNHFVDLNEPVIRGEKVYYPIVHPNASAIPQWPQALGEDQDGVEGFSYNQLPGRELSEAGPIGEEAARVGKSRDGHVAMPVKWIYQLADGTLGVLNDAGSADAPSAFQVLSGNGTPSAKNPMVARFAFWADDETTKLNINTHAGGLAWDIPKAGGELDMNMGRYQPAQKEWQRYPGHPASTHLIPALAPGVLDIVNDRDAMEMLFDVVPRVVGGGSESGTRIIDTRRKEEENGLIADKEPLFPTIDDVIMRSDRTPHEFPDAKGRPIPADELAEYLERSKFFITANSRAPETTLFNLPRIAMWPVYDAVPSNSAEYDKYLTPFDQLIHYCASMGKADAGGYPRFEYVFKRKKADSASYDYEDIPRNKILYEYLRRSLDEPVPGYGQSFSGKYGETSAAQLATMAFDYIRSTNLHDDTVYREGFQEAFKTINTNEHATFTNPRDGNDQNKGFGLKGHGQVTPLRIESGGATTKGMGRFFTLSSAEVLVATVAAHAQDPMPANHSQRYPGVGAYNARHVQGRSGGVAYTNLPPLPPGINSPTDPADKSSWPNWLKVLEMSGPAEEFKAAFDPSQWNWQLAFLDPDYAKAVMGDPTASKYQRNLITPAGSDRMRLEPGARLLQGVFLFNLFCPSIGWVGINPNMQIEIEKMGGQMSFDGDNGIAKGSVGFIGFDGAPGYDQNADGLSDGYVWATNWVKPVQEAGARPYGGLVPFSFTFSGREVHGEKGKNAQASVRTQLWNDGRKLTSSNIFSRLTPLDRGYNHLEGAISKVDRIRSIGENSPKNVAQAYRYDLVTVPFKVSAGGSVNFKGGDVQFRFFDGGDYCENSAQDDQDDADSETLVQTIDLEFPGFSFGLDKTYVAPGGGGYVNEFDDLSSDSYGVLEQASLTADPANPWDSPEFSAAMRGGTWRNSVRPPSAATFYQNASVTNLNSRGRMSNAIHWDGRYIGPGDIVQSVAVPHGDMRVVASRAVIAKSDQIFQPHRSYGKSPMAHSLTNSMGEALTGFSPTAQKDYLIVSGLGNNPYNGAAPLPFAGDKKSQDIQQYGDFDNGAGLMIDGPYINKPDEGNTHSLKTRFTQEVNDYWDSRRNYGEFPYFSNPEYGESGGPSYFSPNRVVSGPGMLGSLPTALFSNPAQPWQTLLFRPNVVGNGYKSHPGAGKKVGGVDPPDHVFMDLFWMPIVEPYAISEPLSTGGKVNLNFDIVPFQHIQRSTALRGVFRSEMMLCIPNKWHADYKHNRGRGRGYHWRDNPYGGNLQGKRLRAAIREDDTIEQFYDRFENGANLFKSASEICEIHLVPEEVSARLNLGSKGSIGSYVPTTAQMSNGKYWRDHSVVGDNSRERPYTNIHNRLTTKSNTFLVHYRAQVLKQARRDDDGGYKEWNPTTDTVQAEYRGSSLVERYVNPEADDIPDFAATGHDNVEGIDAYVRYRVVNPRRFAP